MEFKNHHIKIERMCSKKGITCWEGGGVLELNDMMIKGKIHYWLFAHQQLSATGSPC